MTADLLGDRAAPPLDLDAIAKEGQSWLDFIGPEDPDEPTIEANTLTLTQGLDPMLTQETAAVRTDIARTIISQLGGNRLVAMTGARYFVALESGLRFQFPRISGLRVKFVQITLDPSDTYTVKFFNAKGELVTGPNGQPAEYPDTYCDQLVDLVATVTGLALSL